MAKKSKPAPNKKAAKTPKKAAKKPPVAKAPAKKTRDKQAEAMPKKAAKKAALVAKTPAKPKGVATNVVRPKTSFRAAKKGFKPGKKAPQPTPEVVEQKPSPRPTASKKGVRPLDGIRVLDLTRLLPGPAATLTLASFGAEVIKIEDPSSGGDYAREAEPLIGEQGAVFGAMNRGKKSVAIDLKDPRGKEAFIKLARKADIIIEGFRPGEMKELGLDHPTLSKHHKGLIYVALTGYGQYGLYETVVGHDLNYMAMSGALGLLGSEGVPSVPGMQIADMGAGALPAVIGALLALQARERTGKGQLVDVSMLEGLLGLLAGPVAGYVATKRKPKPGTGRLFGEFACYNIYPVRNGRFMAVGALEPKYWANLCNAIDRDDLVEDQFSEGDRQQVLIAELTRVFQKKEVREWLEFFEGQDVCVSEVRDIAAAVHDEHLLTREAIVNVKGPEGVNYPHLAPFPALWDTPGRLGGDAPKRGEHTVEILKRVGISAKRIAEMTSSGAAEQS